MGRERALALVSLIVAALATVMSVASVLYARRARRLLAEAHRPHADRQGLVAQAPAPGSIEEFFGDAEGMMTWRNHVADFAHDAYPIFAPHGITPGEARIIWELNRIRWNIRALGEDPDQDAPWKAP